MFRSVKTDPEWRDTSRPAAMEEVLPDGVVRCHLSPRLCTLKEGQHGFCGVRMNQGGRLVTLNYGKSVHATEETIETEAVNHFSPGERILSMGNIGCMLNCAYCHNWKTSQSKYVADQDIRYYTPEDVIAIALRHNIRMLSWTYNDPVVWHEFVKDTAKLAKKHGLMNLYKSAFFITEEAVRDLIPYMDIFSISIKSLSEEYYKKYTKGRLQPVLDATKIAYKAGAHIEISTLMLTDITDNEDTARQVAGWVLKELDSTVPVHFVRFHPDYRMRNTIRTPVERLVRAREVGKEMGLRHVYLGNVYDSPYSNTYCNHCNAMLVRRYGLNASILGLDARGYCQSCGANAHFKMRPSSSTISELREQPQFDGLYTKSFDWHGDVRSLHVQLENMGRGTQHALARRRHHDGASTPWQVRMLGERESYRFIVAQSDPNEVGCDIAMPAQIQSNLHEVFDRAHFPTVPVEVAGIRPTDRTPLPLFQP